MSVNWNNKENEDSVIVLSSYALALALLFFQKSKANANLYKKHIKGGEVLMNQNIAKRKGKGEGVVYHHQYQ